MATTGSSTVYFLIDPSHDSPKMAPGTGLPSQCAEDCRCRAHGNNRRRCSWTATVVQRRRALPNHARVHDRLARARTKHGKHLYRLFCRHDRKALGLPGPALVLVTGGVKRNETAFSKTFYRDVRKLGDRYVGSNPREVLR